MLVGTDGELGLMRDWPAVLEVKVAFFFFFFFFLPHSIDINSSPHVSSQFFSCFHRV